MCACVCIDGQKTYAGLSTLKNYRPIQALLRAITGPSKVRQTSVNHIFVINWDQ